MRTPTKLISAIALLLFSSQVEAQCTLDVTPAAVTINCGESVDLSALGLSPTPVLATNFDGGTIGPGWSTTATMLYNNPCGPTLDGTPAAWFGNVPLPRTLTTNGFDVSCGGQVCFDLDFAGDDACGGCSDCEDPDLQDEGVFFQYSIDGGATWVDIFYFEATNNYANAYYQWANYCFNIPPAAWTTSTMFQWDQPNATSSVNDHWGIDNVTIVPSNCGYWYDWDNIAGTNDPPQQTVSPMTTTTYNVIYTDGIDACAGSVTVTVNPLIAQVTAPLTSLNCGDCTTLDINLLNDNSGSIIDNFDPAEDPLMWNDLQGGTANTNCGSMTGNAMHFDGTGQRYATTVPIDATVCTNIDFCLFMGNTGSGGAPCENADANENVVLEYSTDGGATWVNINTYDHSLWDANNNWQCFTETIPLAAQTINTLFRWNQPQFSSCTGCDNWALDDVNIACAPPMYNYSWTPTTGMNDPSIQTPTVCPTADITYTGTITNPMTGCSASDNISITVANCTCQFDIFTASIVQCQPGGTFDVTGTYQYSNNPGTGTILIQATNGSGTYSQTINPPFTDNNLFNYTITGIPSDGTPVTVTIVFSDDAMCTATVNDNSPILPTVTAVNGGANYCPGDPVTDITVDVTGTGPWTIDYTLDGVPMTANGAASPVSLGTTPGVYVVMGVTDANCSNTAAGTQTILIHPTPTFTVAGTDPTTCNGNDGFITVSGLDPNTTYDASYVDDGMAMGPTNYTSDGAGVFIIPGLNPGTYDNFVLQNLTTGCIGTIPNVVIINNMGAPVVNSVTGGNTYCAGDPIADIQVDVTGMGPFTIDYTLDGAAMTANGATSPVSLGAATGVYIVTGVTDAVCNNTASGTQTITVNALPIMVNVSGGSTYCPGDPINDIMVDMTGAGSWTINYTLDGVVNTANGNASPMSLGNNVGVYVITGISDANCTNTANGTQTIEIVPAPTVTSVTGGDEYCQGEPVTDVVANVTGTGPWTIDYTLDGTAMTANGAASPVVLGAGAGVYMVTGISDANCSNTAAGTQMIIINPLPNVSAGNDFTICQGEQAILTGSGALFYAWDNGVVDGSPFGPTATATYTVIGTDANGCVNTDDMVLTVEESPNPSFTADILSGCSPLTVQFTNTTPGNITGCEWSFEGGATLNGCGTIPYQFTSPGLFDVTLTTTSANGCVASITYTDYIYVEDFPNAAFSPSLSVLNTLETEVEFLNNTTGAVDYVWNFGDGTDLSTEVNPTHTFPDDATADYLVQLIASSPLGCVDTAYTTIQVEEEVIFYIPNTFTPDDDDFNPTFQPIFSSGYDPFDFELLIYNRWGEIIFESHNADIGWDGTYGGKLVQQGAYSWKIEFKTTSTDERMMVTGHVNLLK